MCIELPKIIAIVGTTASGKSSLGIELAKIFGGEIISADSRQVFRGFDLCCGKITAEEAQIVPHHLIDIRNIGEPFSVYDFQKLTYSLIPQILNRAGIPFIVGGTGLYVRAVVRGYPIPDESIDIALREELEKLPIDELKARLTFEGKALIDSNPSDSQNKRRIIRMLEKSAHGESLYTENVARYNVLQLGVTWPKEKLHELIEERLEKRINQGMINEIKEYLDNGGNQEYLVKLGLEYSNILGYLTGKYQSLDEFKLKMAQAIKRLAKSQTTWYRSDNSIKWLDMNADYLGQATSLISDFLGPSQNKR